MKGLKAVAAFAIIVILIGIALFLLAYLTGVLVGVGSLGYGCAVSR